MFRSFSYYRWFQKIMSVFIDIFFVAAPMACLYVLTSFLSGFLRIGVFVMMVLAYIAIIVFFRKPIGKIICAFLDMIDHIDKKKMLIIISVTALIAKVIYTVFFSFDATVGGDIQIYNDLADQILATGDLHTRAISHLYGLALHLVVLKYFRIPVHIGLFLLIYCGTMVNFLSFCRIIGKNKAFAITMVYLLMPSTTLLSFAPTHEIFVYFYVSLFLFFYNGLIGEENTLKIILNLMMVIFSTVLTCFVNPGGYIIYIIMVLTIILSNLEIKKKALIALSLAICILCSNMISNYLNVHEFTTALNTYTILIHGTNPEALGEQVDGYPLHEMRKYIYENTLDFSHEGFIDAAKHVFFSQCIYLITHPLNLVRLVLHKFYILWSGVYYPIELAHVYSAVSDLQYYVFLAINAFIYLFMVTLGLAYRKEKEDEIYISNYKLEFLGVIALTMLCVVLNKYSIYVTLFMYLVSVYRMEIKDEK